MNNYILLSIQNFITTITEEDVFYEDETILYLVHEQLESKLHEAEKDEKSLAKFIEMYDFDTIDDIEPPYTITKHHWESIETVQDIKS